MKLIFYANKGRRCGQALIKSVIPSDLAERLSWEELDKITGRNFGQITTPVQIAYGLYQLGTNFLYPVKPFFISGNLDEFKSKILSDFGENVYERINFEFIESSWNLLKEFGKYNLKECFRLMDMEEQVLSGRTPIALINYDKFIERADKKNGHYLIINGVNGKFVNVMDCGPCNASPGKEIPKKRLENSLMQTPLDYGIVLV